MVIRGGTRGNGKQLGNYLLAPGENEKIEILDIDGRDNRSEAFFKKTLLSMSLTSELTKSEKGLYHGIVNPAYGEEAKMKREDWLKAADMLGEALKLDDQRRVIVLHTKKGRTHAHIVWERYDHKRGVMISDSFSRLAQDRVRKEIEQVFEHKNTPVRNPHRPEMKQTLSRLWQEAKTGEAFIKLAAQEGYTITKGQRRPFMVIDPHGISSDLVRQLDGVKTKDVREKLTRIPLAEEKAALSAKRKETNARRMDHVQETMTDQRAIQQELSAIRRDEKEQTKQLAKEFADNRQDTSKPSTPSLEEIEAMKQKVLEELKAMRERQEQQRQQRKRGPRL